MNKLTKIILAFLGACNLGMQIFIPITISLLVINLNYLNSFQATALLIVALGSSLFNAVRFIEE